MKTIVHPTETRKRSLWLPFATAAVTLCLICGSATARVQSANKNTVPVTGRDTILVQKQQISKKHKIKLYPNANHQVLFFSASGEEGRVFQLFVFDLDGKLIKQVNIRNRQTTVLNSIDKGNYFFEVFSDDERIENGQLIVK